MKKLIGLSLCGILGVGLIGCGSVIKNVVPATQQAQEIIDISKKSATDLHQTSKDIKTETSKIGSVVDQPTKVKIQPNLDKINVGATKVDSVATVLETQVVPKAVEVKKNVTEVAAQRDKIEEQLRKEKENNKIRNALGYMSIGSLVVTLGSIGWFVYSRSRLATTLIGVAGIASAVSAALYTYFQFFVIGGLIGALAIAAFVAYQMYKHVGGLNDLIQTKTDLSTKLVHIGEVFKNEVTKLGTAGEEVRKKIFGDGPNTTGIASEILNDQELKNQVQEIRESGEIPLADPLANS